MGALSDLQAHRVEQRVLRTGSTLTHRSFPQMSHSMHDHPSTAYATTVTDWADALPTGTEHGQACRLDDPVDRRTQVSTVEMSDTAEGNFGKRFLQTIEPDHRVDVAMYLGTAWRYWCGADASRYAA